MHKFNHLVVVLYKYNFIEVVISYYVGIPKSKLPYMITIFTVYSTIHCKLKAIQ